MNVPTHIQRLAYKNNKQDLDSLTLVLTKQKRVLNKRENLHNKRLKQHQRIRPQTKIIYALQTATKPENTSAY